MVASSGGYGVALRSAGKNFLTNAAGGTIAGGFGGAYVGAGGSVTNAGAIGATGTGTTALAFGAGAKNRLVIDPGASFTGKVDGGNTVGAAFVSTLELATGASSGTLTSLGSKYIDFARIDVDDGASWIWNTTDTLAAGITLRNAGTLSGLVALRPGAFVSNVSTGTIAPANVFYSGTVAGGAAATLYNAGLIYNSLSTNPLQMVAGGTVSNAVSGTIIGSQSLLIRGGAGTVINAGLIQTDTPVYLGGGGTLSNASTGRLVGSSVGVELGNNFNTYSTTDTLTNAGFIQGGGIAGALLWTGGTVVNQSGGQIVGFTGITVASGAATIVNAGTISAAFDAVRFAASQTSRFVLAPSAYVKGKVGAGGSVATPTNILELASGASTGTLTSFGSQFLDFGQIVIDSGASWVLNATDTLGAGVVLTNNGTLTGTVSVPSGGLFTNAAGGTIVGSGLAAVLGTSAGRATIVNAGFIDPATYGVYLPGGGAITNVAAGTIEGTAVGIEVKGGTGTVFNYGTVTGAVGIQLAAGGTVLNRGTVAGATYSVEFAAGTANRLIAGPGAVFTGKVDGGNTIGATAASTLELASGASAGTLSSFGSKYIDFAGITVDAGASWTFAATNTFGASISIATSGTLTNSAAIAAGVYLSAGILTNAASTTIAGPTAAVYGPSGASAATVVNAGVLVGGSNPTRSAGVILFSGGVVTNVSSGSIGAGGVGVYIGGNGSVVNAGTIAGLGTRSGGIEVFGTGSVTNASGGTVTATKRGIVLDNAGSVLNQGLVQASATDAPGIYLSRGGSATNTGTVIGGQQGVFFGQSGSSGGTLTNAGAITGASDAVQFSPGFANRLIVVPGAVFSGTVEGGNTVGATFVSTLELASAASAGTMASLGSQFADFGQITIDAGASWTFTSANSVASSIGITDSGRLTNSAALPGGVVLSGGTLVNAASATITGTLAAVYSPTGASVGTVLNAGVLIGGNNATRSAGIGLFSGGYISNASGGSVFAGALGIYLAGGGTIVNAGLVTGQGTQSGGIQLVGGGSIANASGGTISAVRRGIALIQAGQVSNQGLITVSGTNGYGINMQAGGTVVNTGIVAGINRGVYFGGAGTLTNAGTISGTVADAASFATGFANRLIIDPGAVFNGLVDGGNTVGSTILSTLELASGASTGTLSGLGTKYIDFGRITIDSGASWVLTGNNVLAAGVSIANSGSLLIAGTLNNAKVLNGPISLASGGIFTNQSAGTIVGSGLAAVRGTSAGGSTIFNAGLIDPATYGAYLPGGGLVTNIAGGTIEGTQAGVFVKGAAGTVVNTGSIAGTGAGSYGISLASGGSVVNNSGGTVTGSSFGVRVAGGGTVSNAGSISGATDAVQFAAGAANRLILTPGQTMSGQVDGGNLVSGAFVSTLELASAASNGKISGFGSTFVNFAQVTIDAGAGWSFGGTDSFASGVTLTNAGTMFANGTVTDNGLIASGAGSIIVGSTAGTNGTVVVNAGGTLNVGVSGTTPDLIVGGGVASGTLAAATGTVLVTGAAAALNANGPITIAKGVGTTGQLTIAAGATALAVTSNETATPAVNVGLSGSGTLVVTGNGSTFTADGQVAVGRSGTGTLLVANQGTLVLAADGGANPPSLDIGVGSSTNQAQTGGSGSCTISGGGIVNGGSTTSGVRIGGHGDNGTLVVNGGTLLAGTVKLGSTATIAGTAETGAGFLNIGTGGVVNAGTTSGASLVIGQNQGSSGTVTVNAGTLISGAQIVVGNQTLTNGVLTVGTSAVVTSVGFSVANAAGATGTVVVDDGTLTNTGFMGIGQSGAGVMTIQAGGTVTSTQAVGPAVDIGASSGGTGTVVVTGAGSALNVNGQFAIGDQGTGSLDVNTNGLVNAGNNAVDIGNQAGGAGTVTVESGGSLAGGVFAVGFPIGGTASGQLTIGAGGAATASGLSADGGGTIVVGGASLAQLTVSGVTTIGQNQTGATMTVNAHGVVTDTGGLNVATNGGSGTVVVNGGSLGGGSFQIGGTGAGTVTVQANGQLTAYSTVAADSIGGGIGGSGTLIVNGGSVAVTTPHFAVGGSNSVGRLLVENNGQLLTTLSSGGFAGEGDIDSTGTGVASATITSGGTWTVSTGTLIVGNAGQGSLDINSNGVLNLGTTLSLTIGQQDTSYGTLTIENGGTLLGGALRTGNGASGAASIVVGAGGFVGVTSLDEQYGGTVVVGGTSAAVVNVSGGIFVGSEDAGTGNATLTINAGGTVNDVSGGFTAFNLVQVGQAAGTRGTIAVNAGTLTDAGALNVNKGLVTIYAGGIVTVGTASGIQIGQLGTGTVLVNGGSLTGAASLMVANGLLSVSGGGVINVSGGALALSSVGSTGSGTVVVNGGTLTQTGGGLTFGGSGIGGGPGGPIGPGGPGGGASGVLLVQNGGTLTTTDTNGVAFDTATGTVTGATWIDNSTLNIGAAGTIGSLDVNSSGTLNATGQTIVVGQSAGIGTLSVESGGTIVAGALSASDNLIGSTGLIAIGDQGTVQATSLSIGADGTVTLGGTAHTALLTDSGHVSVGSGGSDSAQLIINQFGSLSDTGTSGFAIGAASGASGTVVVNGGRLTNSDVLSIGQGGAATGVLLIEGGGTVIGSYASGGPAVDIDGANASGTVTGSGSLWNLTGSGQQLIVGDSHAGMLSVLNGGTVNAGNDTIDIGNQNGGNGTVVVGGSNALLEGGALVIGLALGSAGTLTINTGGSVNATSVHLGASGNIVLAGGTLDPPATITIDAGGTISGYGTIDGGLAGGGTVIATGGVLDVTGSVASGSFIVTDGATLQLDGSVAAGTTIGFSGTAGILSLGTGGFSGTLSRFLQGDSIVLPSGTAASSATISPPGTLDIKLAGGGDIFIPLDNTFDYAGGTFNVFTSNGTTTITDTVTPCYLAGTMIRTDRGEIRVEDLAIGDSVVTLDGSAKPIRWIGKRAYAAAFAAGNRDIIPILIKQGALGDNVPVRDLYVSPLHAMYFDGVLVQAEHLVNGSSIVRCSEIDPIRYFHIELDAHDIVFAEGAPAETFVDCDSRGMFHNATEFAALYPNAAPAVWAFCAPRIESGPVLESIRAAIDTRAGLVRTRNGQMTGNLDGLDGRTVTGWAYDPTDPDGAVELEILDGDGTIARVVANRYRADLELAGIGDGRHGFELRLARPLSPQVRHELRVRRVGDRHELPGSPLAIDAVSRKSLLKEVRKAVDAATEQTGDLDALLDTYLEGIDRIRRLRATQATGTAVVPSEAPKQALILSEKLPRRGHDDALLSHIAALRSLGWTVEILAADELARGDDAVTALKAWGVVCHRAPMVASAEELLRRKRDMFGLVYLSGGRTAEAYAGLVRASQKRARVLYGAGSERPEASNIPAMRMADAIVVQSADDVAWLREAAPGARVHAVPRTLTAAARGMPQGEYRGIAVFADAAGMHWLEDAVMPLVRAQEPDMPLVVGGELDNVRVAVALGRPHAVLDCLAAGVPCVTRDAAGLGLPETLRGLEAKDPVAMAALILDLHGKASLNGRFARAGLAFVRAEHSEAAVAAAMRDAAGESTPRAASRRAG